MKYSLLVPDGASLCLGVMLVAFAYQAGAQTPAVVATGSLTGARYHHAAVVLPNGKVLAAGGHGSNQIATAELYNPTTGTWATTGSMTSARFVHTATLLTNGLVLVAGGFDGGSYLASAELYDSTNGTWAATGAMNSPRYNHTATLLPNGKVLVAGGNNGGTWLTSTELYDPVSGTWSTNGPLTTARVEATAVLLTNGLVLIAGGRDVGGNSLASAELYNPATGTWSASGSMSAVRESHAMTVLADGRVLVAGGVRNFAGQTHLSSAEIYNPATGTWTVTGSLGTARQYHRLTRLPSGKVLAVGGNNGPALTSTELFNPTSGTWSTSSSLQAGRYHFTATTLVDGRVLLTGGQQASGGAALSSAELIVEAPAGLVAYYPGNGNAQDAAGGNHGTLVNGTAFTTGVIGQAFSFDGVDDQVEIPHTAANSPSNAVTVSAWIRPLAYEDNKHCVSKGSHVNYFSRSYSLQGPWADGKWRATLSVPGGEVVVASATNAVLAGWSHVLMTYDGTAVKLYVNGELAGSQSTNGLITQTSEPLILGSHKFYAASDYWFNGAVDEVQIYDRALSAAEVAQLYSTTPASSAPVITGATNATATVGQFFTYTIMAANNPTGFGATGLPAGLSVNATTGVISGTPAATGTFTVTLTASNANGTGTANLTLMVNPATVTSRAVRVVNVSGSSGSAIQVPVELLAQGDENALGFSLAYDTSLLTFTSAALGGGATGATLNINSNQLASGRLGFALGLAAGARFAAGTQEVVRVTFQAANVSTGATANVAFGDAPLAREIADATANTLVATYQSGTVTLTVGYEGDVTPRPNGSGAVSISDWVQVGRFAAGLDAITNSAEFQRADCAPRSSLGNGSITIADWVQAGRYAAGLDPLTPAGGPTVQTTGLAAQAVRALAPAGAREVRVVSVPGTAGQPVSVSLELLAQGDENALGFSVTFDTARLTYTSAALGAGASGATLNINSSQTASGKLGMALALGAGQSFAAGTRALVTLTFQAAANATGTAAVGFGNAPIPQEVSDALANVLSTTFTAGAVNFSAPALPVLVTSPQSQSFNLGGATTLSVTANGTGLNYQWQFNGVNLTGANSATLSLVNLTATNAGAYRVLISNAGGTVTSQPASLLFFGDLKFVASTVLAGPIGQEFRVDYADVVTVGVTNWLTLTNVILPSSPFLVVDPTSSGRTQRYYRAVPLP